MTQKLNLGEIWLANLNPKYRTEPDKVRPVLIIQDQSLLDVQHPSTLIIPLTTKLIDDVQPLRIRVKAQDLLEKDLDLLIDQLRAIDNKRLTTGPIAKCDKNLVKKVYAALFEIIGARIEEFRD